MDWRPLVTFVVLASLLIGLFLWKGGDACAEGEEPVMLGKVLTCK